ncbi:MAG: ABC transporter permease, partial [Planctomycetota bacterium]
GHLKIGYELARQLNLNKGDRAELMGRSFTVAKCLPESGLIQDISIFGHLHDVQALVSQKEKINEIQALDCVCFDSDTDALQTLREQLAPVLPDAKVLQIKPIADARLKQRKMVEDYLAVIVPFALVVCAAWIGLLAMINVRERRQEIGIFRALGYGSSRIASLFLGKAGLVGILGALIGFAIGAWLALVYG